MSLFQNKFARGSAVVSLALAAIFLPVSANSATLTFEDVPGGSIQNGVGAMPAYQGFNFSPNLAWIDLEGSFLPYGAHGGDFGIINSGGVGVLTTVGGLDFTFEGLYAKKSATNPESGGADSLFGVLSGYNDGSLIWTVDTSLNGSYEFYAAQAGLIDELRLGFGDFFLVDDILMDISSANTTVVPIPAALPLFISGLLGLGVMARRRKQKAV